MGSSNRIPPVDTVLSVVERDPQGSSDIGPLGADRRLPAPGREVGLGDMSTGKEVLNVTAHRVGAFTPDAERLPLAGLDRTIKAWEREHGQDYLRLTDPGQVLSLAFASDGKRFAAGG